MCSLLTLHIQPLGSIPKEAGIVIFLSSVHSQEVGDEEVEVWLVEGGVARVLYGVTVTYTNKLDTCLL